MSRIDEMALELGKTLGRTEEYQALRRAMQAMDEDRELTRIRNEIERLESTLMAGLQAGREPSEEEQQQYEALARSLQSSPIYQRLVAGQTNFDKVLQRMNETISRGIQEGGVSRIILSP
jgi:cell fate (sporulation/competence/biofilm development) regulator YlbF (YheA/YmcA/DUF963 family)